MKGKNIPEDIKLYTVAEVAQILRVNKSIIYELIRCGRLSAIKLASIKITHTALAKFIKEAEGFDVSNPPAYYAITKN